MPSMTRRALLAGGLGFTAYSLHKGLRYPRLSIEPNQLANSFDDNGCVSDVYGLIRQPLKQNDVSDELNLYFRAYIPEPHLKFQSSRQQTLSLELNNISSEAVLSVSGVDVDKISEHIQGAHRKIEVPLNKGQEVNFKWSFPEQDEFEFAVIGDTGGGSELIWSIERATQLGAKFLLHLGDINYSEGEYDLAIEQFKASSIPCYISIGNHDFHDDGLIYHRFRENLGPLNTKFSLGGVCFINVDTAADFFPANSGLRAQLLQEVQLKDSANFTDSVVFTHRPFVDVRDGHDHVIGGVGEIDWLAKTMQSMNCHTLLTGHVHRSAEREYEGINQYSAGEGLGHQDIVSRKQVAQLLIGKVAPKQKVEYKWVSLEMPWSVHQSPNHTKWLLDNPRSLDWYHRKLTQS